tara:strand:+ start:266 stop:439 length:174 start_codon:yes stop_codon:yes gene_type:complete
MIDPKEYMSSDVWKRNIPPVTNFKRGSAYNQFGMWVMWSYYILITGMIIRLIVVLNS